MGSWNWKATSLKIIDEGKKFSTSVKIKECMYGKPSRRMIGEAVYIDDLLDSEAMNGKNEWSYVRL